MNIPPIPKGHHRQWLQCRTCQRVYHYDYIPFSLSNPMRWTPCGHGYGKDLNCTYITADEALVALTAQEPK